MSSPRGRSLGRFVLLLLVCVLALQLYFLARIALMAMLDPQSTTFQRSAGTTTDIAAAASRHRPSLEQEAGKTGLACGR